MPNGRYEMCLPCRGAGCAACNGEGVVEAPIVTHHEYPPIPDRRFDWCAYRDPEGLVGWGRTEAEARADLLELEDCA